MNLALIIALIIFIIKGLAVLFTWDLHKFDAIAWGLAFFTLGHMWVYVLGGSRNPQ